jgi:hypothetical protein
VKVACMATGGASPLPAPPPSSMPRYWGWSPPRESVLSSSPPRSKGTVISGAGRRRQEPATITAGSTTFSGILATLLGAGCSAPDPSRHRHTPGASASRTGSPASAPLGPGRSATAHPGRPVVRSATTTLGPRSGGRPHRMATSHALPKSNSSGNSTTTGPVACPKSATAPP